MKYIFKTIVFGLLLVISDSTTVSAQKHELTDKWDTIRPLANPDKGWYHHMLDNGVNKYLIQNEEDFLHFPGMDHLYLRLAWAFLEPEEGKFDWSYIDTIVEKYIPLGYKISFRITCKETGPAPGSVPFEINDTRYATPYWVIKAGAKGIEKPEFGIESWSPNYDDPIFLEKLDNFHKAFAARYDGKPYVRYIDVGSIGDWGEGHTWRSTRVAASVETIKTHLNIHLKHYKKTQLIVADDLLATGKSLEEQNMLLNYVLSNSISLRDDSPMVQGYMENDLSNWTVRNYPFFKEVYKTMPTVFELEHYGKVKKNGYWLGKEGSGIIPTLQVSGADVFRNAIKIIRPTYIGWHGYIGEWLTDNPNLTKELLNLCGYWYFPKSVEILEHSRKTLSFKMEWLNKGVAPAYNSYQLKVKLIPTDNATETIDFEMEDSGNKKWMPNQVSMEIYKLTLSKKLKGEYWLAIQLFDKKSNTPVDIGLLSDSKRDNYFRIQKIIF